MNRSIQLFFMGMMLIHLSGCATSDGESDRIVSPTDQEEGQGADSQGSEVQGMLVPVEKQIPIDPGPMSTYRIGPYDLLQVEVFQVPELSGEEVVSEAGTINIALIGDIKVAGLTTQEAEARIAERLGADYLQNPQVDVRLKESANQRVTVTGHVKKPGIFPLSGRMTLMQAIALAGGVDKVGKKSEVLVFRKHPDTGAMRAYVVDLAKIEEGETKDPLIVSDDRIFVPESGARVLINTVRGILSGWATRYPFQ